MADEDDSHVEADDVQETESVESIIQRIQLRSRNVERFLKLSSDLSFPLICVIAALIGASSSWRPSFLKCRSQFTNALSTALDDPPTKTRDDLCKVRTVVAAWAALQPLLF